MAIAKENMVQSEKEMEIKPQAILNSRNIYE